ncbi:unnamed protein product [Polarella glacialis]|uniref:Uncharacterized protein n=1 Tax=Polarella glacialis TaxID=89957 RepID=A0A813HQ57_POLGL|nr:unnamed protein product [Polarella glacialis]
MVEMAKAELVRTTVVGSDCKPPQVRFRRPSINDTAGRRQVAIERNEQGSKNDLSGLLTELRLLREEMDNIRQEAQEARATRRPPPSPKGHSPTLPGVVGWESV